MYWLIGILSVAAFAGLVYWLSNRGGLSSTNASGTTGGGSKGSGGRTNQN
jgi:hypothetical protein